MPHHREQIPPGAPGLPRADGQRGLAPDPTRRGRIRPSRPNPCRHGPVGVREDDPAQQPERAAEARQRPDLPQQGHAMQEVEAEDLLRPAAGHLLPGPDAEADAGVHRQAEAARHRLPLAEDAVRRPHHRRAGADALPGHDHRRLHQEGAERGREEEGEYRVRVVDESFVNVVGRE